MSARDPGPIPKRWLNCPPIANGLIEQQLLAFKTPLGHQFNEKVPRHNHFSPADVFKHVQKLKRKLGLWIDLTNTSRFYDKEEIAKMNCKYVKLKCRGHGERPSEEQTKKFLDIVTEFTELHPDQIVGVHCTHGFNRTGFLMIAFMVQRADYCLMAALQEFANVRFPGIYKKDYLDDLYKRYKGDDEDIAPTAPARPDWCIEEEEEESDDESREPTSCNEPTSSGRKTSKRRRMNKYKNKQFMEGVSGAVFLTEEPLVSQIQDKAIKFCKWESETFPGLQPVSMDRNNIKYLESMPYRVSWKADGVRYMMLIEGPGKVYMIDRDNCVFQIENLSFPHNKEDRHLTDTLLDGEMVIDKMGDQVRARYLCYDIIRFDNVNVGKSPFHPVRGSCIMNEIIKPRHRAMANGTIIRDNEPFSVTAKDFWDVTMAEQLLEEKFTRKLCHEPDGLIFQPADEPYVAGPCPKVLKWKPPELNSIDFRLKIIEERKPGMLPEKVGCLYVGGLDRPFAAMKVTKALKQYDNKIIECSCENGQWKFMRERTDKSFPNRADTAEAVWKSIAYPVTKDYLLSFIKYRCTFNAPNFHH